MIELYWIALGLTAIVLILAARQVGKWPRDRTATIRVGDVVQAGGVERYVLAAPPLCHHTTGALAIQRALGGYVFGHVLYTMPSQVTLVRRGSGYPSESEARALNTYYGVTCDLHPRADCTHKARQRIKRLLPGHQL